MFPRVPRILTPHPQENSNLISQVGQSRFRLHSPHSVCCTGDLSIFRQSTADKVMTNRPKGGREWTRKVDEMAWHPFPIYNSRKLMKRDNGKGKRDEMECWCVDESIPHLTFPHLAFLLTLSHLLTVDGRDGMQRETERREQR